MELFSVAPLAAQPHPLGRPGVVVLRRYGRRGAGRVPGVGVLALVAAPAAAAVGVGRGDRDAAQQLGREAADELRSSTAGGKEISMEGKLDSRQEKGRVLH